MPRFAPPLTLALTLIAGAAAAQTADYPRTLPAPGGEVIIPSLGWQRAYDEYRYAPARRAGDTLYVSGAVVGPAPDEGTDAAAFEAQVRRALGQLNRVLTAAGATMNDVILINSFHVWDSPHFAGSREEQIRVIGRVWGEFADGPRPAWTAVGTSGLVAENGIVEIQLTVHSPARD